MRTFSLFLSAIALIVFTACGGDSSSPNTNPSSATSSISENAKPLAATGALLSDDFVTGMLDITSSFTGSNAAQLRSQSRQAIPCQGGGEMNFNYTASAIDISFNSCVNGPNTLTGTMSISGYSPSSSSMSNSVITFTNFTMNDGTTESYMNMTMNASTTVSGSSLSGYDITINGTMRQTESGATKEISFSNYHAQMSNSSVTINGTITVNNTPDTCGSNGTYAISTTTPLTYDSSGEVTGGTLVINGNTYTFNGDGTVTVNGTDTVNIEDLQACQA